MASSAPAPQMPLFYNQVQPLSSKEHAKYRARTTDKAPHLAKSHAIPLTVDEFVAAQRFYPIVFSAGDNAVPLALMGLNEGVNVFLDEDGKLLGDAYVPAYARRYPFILARLRPDSDELSLCFDASSDLVGDFKDGESLFDGGKPSERTNAVLKFCEDFEMAAQRTSAFVKELSDMDLLIDGEVAIQMNGTEQPFVYRGFRMVAEDRFRELKADQLEKISKNGILPLVMAHLFSLPIIREVFAKQVAQGKGPQIPGAAAQ